MSILVAYHHHNINNTTSVCCTIYIINVHTHTHQAHIFVKFMNTFENLISIRCVLGTARCKIPNNLLTDTNPNMIRYSHRMMTIVFVCTFIRYIAIVHSGMCVTHTGYLIRKSKIKRVEIGLNNFTIRIK